MALLAGLKGEAAQQGLFGGGDCQCTNLPQISFTQHISLIFFFSSMTVLAPLKQFVKLIQKTNITSCPGKFYVLVQPTAITTNRDTHCGNFPPDYCISTQIQVLPSFPGQTCRVNGNNKKVVFIIVYVQCLLKECNTVLMYIIPYNKFKQQIFLLSQSPQISHL